MKRKGRIGTLLLITSGLSLAPLAQATDYSWTGTATLEWATANWSGTPPVDPTTGPTATDNVLFSQTAARVISLNGNRSANAISTSATAAWTLQGGIASSISLLTANSIANYGTTIFQLRNGNPTALMNVEVGNLILDGGTSASFSLGTTAASEAATNWLNSLTVTGETRVTGGTININIRNATNTSNSYSLGLLNMSGGALNLNYSYVTKDAVANVTGLSGSGGTVEGVKTPTGATNTGTTHLIITAADDYSSGTVLGDGSSGGLLKVTKSGSGTQTLTGANTYTGGTIVSEGRLQLGNGGTTGSIAGNVELSGATAELSFNRSNAYTFAGIISGSGRVVQVGTGTTTLSGTNSYSGGTVIEGGKIQISADRNLGDASGGVTLGSGGRLGFTAGTGTYNRATLLKAGGGGFDMASNTTVNWQGIISGDGGLTKGGSASTSSMLYLSGTNTYRGGTTIEGGAVKIDGDYNLGDASGQIIFNNGSGTARLENTQDMISNREIILNGNTATLSAAGTSTMRLNGVISGVGGINKTFSGTLILAGNNTYAGTTTITTGTILAANTEGSATGRGGVVVNAARVLGGDGIIAPEAGNNVTVDGILRPGMDGAGTLRFDFSGGSKLVFGLGSSLELTLGTDSSQIAFVTAGNWLSGSGNAVLNLTLGEGFSYDGSYLIFQGASTANFTFADVSGYDSNGYSHIISQVGDNYYLSFTAAVPEPSSLLLLGVAGAAWFVRCTMGKRREDVA